MTVRITVTLPDDVGEKLKELPTGQVSAYVTAALRRQQGLEFTQQVLTAAGHRTFEPDSEGSRAVRESLRVPPHVVAETTARLKAKGLLPQDWNPQA